MHTHTLECVGTNCVSGTAEAQIKETILPTLLLPELQHMLLGPYHYSY